MIGKKISDLSTVTSLSGTYIEVEVSGVSKKFDSSDLARVSQQNTFTAAQVMSPAAAAAQTLVINSTATGGPYVTFTRSGSAFGDMGNGGQMGGGFTLDAFAFSARAGNSIQFAANGSTTPHLSINDTYTAFKDTGYIRTDTANTMVFQGGSSGFIFRNSANTKTICSFAGSGAFTLMDTNGSGSAMTIYTSFRDTNFVERGWVGFGNGNTTLTLLNNIGGIYISASDIDLRTAGGVAKFSINTGHATAGQTVMQVYDVDNGQMERVSVGAADSGGAGYKVLRIPN